MTAISGQTTVVTAGSAVALGTGQVSGALLIKALATNTGNIAVGNDGNGDVTVNNGLLLAASECVALEYVGNLSDIYIDAGTDGEGVAWLILG